MRGKLYLVATPIGNLGDITFRAIETLKSVSFIICEDTRHSRKLLQHHGIDATLVSMPAFSEADRVGPLVERLCSGESAAMVSDAGSPGVSDPGEKLVAEALRRGVEVVPIPGPSSLIAALTSSGLPTGRFHFLGFIPRKGVERRNMLLEVAGLSATLVLFESPNRLVETLVELEEVWGNRQACVARELTKFHEQFSRGRLRELVELLKAKEILGEVVLVVEGAPEQQMWTKDEVKQALSEGASAGEKLKTLSKELAQRSKWSANEIYRLGLELKQDRDP